MSHHVVPSENLYALRHSEPGQKIQDILPNQKQRGSSICQSIILTVIVLLLPVNLGKSLVTAVVLNLTSKKFITNVFHQLWSFLDSLLIQALGDFTVHREKSMFLYFHNETCSY